jgi:hypothetical protein
VDIAFVDNSPVFGPDVSTSWNWRSTSSYILFNDSTTAVSAITFAVTQTNAASAGTTSVGNFVAAPAGGIGWACVSNGFADDIQAFWSCTGGLGAKTGTPGNNTPDAAVNVSRVDLDFSMDGIPGATASSTVNWGNTVTCGGTPTPCTSGTVSPANSDGSVLNLNSGNTPATDDPIVLVADLDVTFDDMPGVEQLNSATPPVISVAQYTLFNDRSSPLRQVTFSGTVTSNAATFALAAAVSNGGAGGTAGDPGAGAQITLNAWTCSTTPANTWTCTGDLTPDTLAGSANNAPNAGDQGNFVVITLTTTATGNTGDTITYTPSFTCGNPTPCTSGVVTPANQDGSSYPTPDVDTLT